jgi:hypothetical protein
MDVAWTWIDDVTEWESVWKDTNYWCDDLNCWLGLTLILILDLSLPVWISIEIWGTFALGLIDDNLKRKVLPTIG